MNDFEKEFSRTMSESLDQSLDEFDPSIQDELAAIRHKVLNQSEVPQLDEVPQRHEVPQLNSKNKAKQWQYYAIAASVLVLFTIPLIYLQNEKQSESYQSYLSVDPDMLLDWDMLELIGEEYGA